MECSQAGENGVEGVAGQSRGAGGGGRRNPEWVDRMRGGAGGVAKRKGVQDMASNASHHLPGPLVRR